MNCDETRKDLRFDTMFYLVVCDEEKFKRYPAPGKPEKDCLKF